MAAPSRFQLLSTQELSKLSDNAKNNNTTKSTNTWLNVYHLWAVERSKGDLTSYEPVELNTILCQFFGDVRKADGTEYEPDSLRAMLSSLHRFLKERKYAKPLLTDV